MLPQPAVCFATFCTCLGAPVLERMATSNLNGAPMVSTLVLLAEKAVKSPVSKVGS